jgi:endonuclease/exonuclease/phosphatase family metal-dependent hydrolase
MRRYLLPILLLPVLLLSLATATQRPAARRPAVAIASWNMEWLVSPGTAQGARLACRRGQRAALPCDVARDLSRDSADLSRLAWYARRLDADVIAFQEVEDEGIAARIFDKHRICIAPGRGLQRVGFAIRRGIAHRCGPPLEAISLDGTQRNAMTLVLFPGTSRAVELLAVHLKSGCADSALDSGSSACRLLAAQADHLASWIAARANSRFILLGDFNRGDTNVDADEFWRILSGTDPAAAPFAFASAGTAFRNCHIGAGFTRAIDHILVSRSLLPDTVQGSFARIGYREADAVRYRLPDHCPVRFLLRARKNSQGAIR